MIDNVIDEVKDTHEEHDTNHEMGNRVKRYTLVTKYFDNYLRISNGLILKDYIIYTFLLSIISTYFYNKLVLGLNYDENLLTIRDGIFYLFLYISDSLINSKLINTLNDFLILGGADFKIPLLNLLNVSNYDLRQLDSGLIGTYLLTWLSVSFWFGITYYQFYAQKQIFNSGILNYYIPKIFLLSFFFRTQNEYFYLRLIKHQQNKAFMKLNYELLVRNLFFKNDIDIEKTLTVIFQPKRWFYIYDFFKFYYKEEERKSSSRKEKLLDKLDKQTKINSKRKEFKPAF